MIRDEILATKIIERALSNVKEKLEPLTYAVNILTPKAVGEEIHCVATDGNYLFFNAFQTIQYYERGEVSTIEYQIIHILLHGILGHFEDTAYVRKKLAWRVMDLSVEQILTQIGIHYKYFECAKREYSTIGMGLYYQASTDKRMAQTILRQGRWKAVDDHSYWWRKPAKSGGESNGSGKGGFLSDSDGDVNKVAERWEKAKEYLLGKEAAEINLNQISTRQICKVLNKKFKGSGHGTESGEKSRCVQPDGEELSFREVFSEFLKRRCVYASFEKYRLRSSGNSGGKSYKIYRVYNVRDYC